MPTHRRDYRLIGVGLEDVYWVVLAQHRTHWRAFLNTVMDIQNYKWRRISWLGKVLSASQKELRSRQVIHLPVSKRMRKSYLVM